jgi:hypothetical protein
MLVADILKAVVAAVDVPVTLKIRTGVDPQHRNGPSIARIAEDAGIALLAVHGRTRVRRALISVSDKTGLADRVRPRTAPAGRRDALHRRHRQAAHRGRRAGHRGIGSHRLPGDHGRPGQDPASAHPRRHPRPARRRRRASCARTRSSPSTWSWSTSTRSRRPSPTRAATLDGHREHRHRRPHDAARGGQEPPAVTVVVDPADYAVVIDEMADQDGAVGDATRFDLAVKAFEHTAAYDGAIANYFGAVEHPRASRRDFPNTFNLQFRKRSRCAMARTRIRRPPSTSSAQPPRQPSPAPSSCRARSCLQQHRRHRRRAGMRQAVRRGPGLRHRQARQPLRRRLGRRPAATPMSAPSHRSGIGLRRHHRLQPDARRETAAGHRRAQFVEVIIAPEISAEAAAAVAAPRRTCAC